VRYSLRQAWEPYAGINSERRQRTLSMTRGQGALRARIEGESLDHPESVLTLQEQET